MSTPHQARSASEDNDSHPAAPGRVLLYSHRDDNFLSDLVCLLRAQLEVFAATPDDVGARRKRGDISVGRVGIRCIHCRHTPYMDRAKGAVSYPNSIQTMNQAVRNWQRYHFLACECIPDRLKEEYHSIKGKRVHSSKSSMNYWIESCDNMGMVDGKGGIFFKSDLDDSDAGGGEVVRSLPVRGAPLQHELPPPHQTVPRDEIAPCEPRPHTLPQVHIPPPKKGGERAHCRSSDANNLQHRRLPGVRTRSPSSLPQINIPPPKKGRQTALYSFHDANDSQKQPRHLNAMTGSSSSQPMETQPPSSQNLRCLSSNSAPSSDDDASAFLGVQKADELEEGGEFKSNDAGLALELNRARQEQKELEAGKRELQNVVDGLRGQVEDLEQDLAYERQRNNSLRERIQLLEERLRRSRRVDGFGV